MQHQGRQHDDADTAVRNAHSAFRSAARQRLKRLQAAGVEDTAASSRLLDDLIDTRGERSGRPPASSSSSASVQHVMACTGANAAQASQVVRLRDEISRLRREGHSTASLIEQLKERLRSGGEPPASWDENGEEQGAWRSGAAGAPSKKRRVGEKDEGAPSPPGSLLGVEAPPRLSPLSEYGACGYLGDVASTRACPPCPADSKRQREDSAPLAQLKKLKLRPQDS